MHELKDERGAHWRVPPQVQLGEDHAAISFPANGGFLRAHPRGDVHFPDGNPDDGAILLPRDVIHDTAGGEIGDDAPLPMPQHNLRRERQRVVFADRLPFVGHERETVHIRINRKADIGT